MKVIILLSLSLLSFSAIASEKYHSCDKKGMGHKKIVIDSIQFKTKRDRKRKKKKVFSSLLYCDMDNKDSKCNESSFWFTLEGFVKNKAVYKPIICYYKESNITLRDNKINRQSQIVIYVNANK